MNPDPNLVKVKQVLDLTATLSWVLLGITVLGSLGYIGFSTLSGIALVAQIPIIIGFVGIAVSAVMQVIFANSAPKLFPAERGLRLKALLGITTPGILGFIIAAIGSLAVQVITGERAVGGADILFGFTILVCAPITGFLFDAGQKMAQVEKKYGVEGAQKLYNTQLTSTLPPR